MLVILIVDTFGYAMGVIALSMNFYKFNHDDPIAKWKIAVAISVLLNLTATTNAPVLYLLKSVLKFEF